jgi:hypothetical protein
MLKFGEIRESPGVVSNPSFVAVYKTCTSVTEPPFTGTIEYPGPLFVINLQ